MTEVESRLINRMTQTGVLHAQLPIQENTIFEYNQSRKQNNKKQPPTTIEQNGFYCKLAHTSV